MSKLLALSALLSLCATAACVSAEETPDDPSCNGGKCDDASQSCADPGYGGIFDEAATLYPLGAGLGFGAVPSRVMFYGVAIVAALAFLIRSSPLRGRVATGAGVAAALAALGLALSASKNPVHAAAVVPAVAVVLAMALGDVSEAARPWSRLVGAVCGLAVLTYLGTVTVRVMTPSTQESAGQTPQPWYAGGWLALVVLAAAVVTALAIRRLPKDGRQRLSLPGKVASGARAASITAVTTASIAAGISVLTTLGPAAAQAGDPASWVGQNTAALRGEGCGLAGEAAGGVPTAVRPLPLAVGAPVLATVAVPTPPVANPNPLIPADTPTLSAGAQTTPGAAAETQMPSPPPGVIAVGDYVQIVGTGGDGLRLRGEPGLAAQVLMLGSESEVFKVDEGPREADGYTWWRLIGPFDTNRGGWAAVNFLQVVQNP